MKFPTRNDQATPCRTFWGNGGRQIFGSLFFILIVAVLTACNGRTNYIEGVVRVSTDTIDHEIVSGVDDDICLSQAPSEQGEREEVLCEDWLSIITPVPTRSGDINGFEVGMPYDTAEWGVYAIDADLVAQYFGLERQEFFEECDLAQQATGTITRLDESQWEPASYGSWEGAYDLEFERGCISGSIRFYQNSKPN